VNNDDYFMTEDDWLASAGPEAIYRPNPSIQPNRMLQFLRVYRRADKTKNGRRKLRLFACACCRRFWPSLSEQSREALDIAERYADGEATKKDLGYAWRNSVRQYGRGLRTADGCAGHVVEAGAMTAAALVPMVCYSVVASTPKQHHELWNELYQQAAIIYDLFGSPFRTTAADAASQIAVVDSVRELAEHIYHSRRFDDLSDLAMKLEQAGCTDTDLLEHCRQPEHFRGCWLVDALRGIPFD
jgi:hypothetical protein